MFKQLISQLYFNKNSTSTPVSETDRLPTELSTSQVTLLRKDLIIEGLENSQFYTGGGRVSVTDNVGVLLLTNPSNSGKIITIGKFFLTSDTNVDLNFIKNVTSVNAPTIRTPDPMNMANPIASVAQIQVGSTNYVGGSTFSSIARLNANITVPFDLPVVLAPGNNVGVAFRGAGLTAIVCYASVAWLEKPI